MCMHAGASKSSQNLQVGRCRAFWLTAGPIPSALSLFLSRLPPSLQKIPSHKPSLSNSLSLAVFLSSSSLGVHARSHSPNVKQKEAAEELGLSTTALKKVCRKLGIARCVLVCVYVSVCV